ncbi:hypothetical protein SAMN05421594_2713 [Chryseobacterium oleae]|uniref:Uncharacterized protein n=1 Tax=Chryseobacterium oleae TaxID=491207 RepID=A0A1I4YVG1_CHROL|nr:hypothetical protein SAMN05421594_2713 [Chryseobacterium oleae]
MGGALQYPYHGLDLGMGTPETKSAMKEYRLLGLLFRRKSDSQWINQEMRQDAK